MKRIKSFQVFEDAQKISDLNLKGRELDKKRNEIKSKAVETAKAQRNEEDPLKSEMLSLTTQKLSMQSEIAKIDMKIVALKIRIEGNK